MGIMSFGEDKHLGTSAENANPKPTTEEMKARAALLDDSAFQKDATEVGLTPEELSNEMELGKESIISPGDRSAMHGRAQMVDKGAGWATESVAGVDHPVTTAEAEAIADARRDLAA
jgi:hypothetical protein